MAARLLQRSTAPSSTVQRVSHYAVDVLSNCAHKDMRDTLMKRNSNSNSASTVLVDRKGFVPSSITIEAGHTVAFESTSHDDYPSKGYNVIEVCHDGFQYKLVPGGTNFRLPIGRSRAEVQFNAVGEYHFGCGVLRCPPVCVNVLERKAIEVAITDRNGFSHDCLYVHEGANIRFKWAQSTIARRVYPAVFCYAHGGLKKVTAGKLPPSTKSGSFTFTCRQDGMVYFVTEDNRDLKQSFFVCVVCVARADLVHTIEIADGGFNPQVVCVRANSAVQFRWSDKKCHVMHCPYEAEIPPLDLAGSDEVNRTFRPAPQGFHWPETALRGLLRQQVAHFGVLHFSDYNHLGSFAEYVGTVLTYPKTNNVAILVDDHGFTPDIIEICLYDRVWFAWDLTRRRNKPVGIVFSKCDIIYNDKMRYVKPFNFDTLSDTTSLDEADNPESLHARLELEVPSQCAGGSNCSKLNLRNLGILTDSGVRNVRMAAVGVFYFVKRRKFPKPNGIAPALFSGKYTYDEDSSINEDEEVDESKPLPTVAVICNYSSQDDFVRVCADHFEPPVTAIYAGDRVWFMWQPDIQPRNVTQVEKDGSIRTNSLDSLVGFSSGTLVNPPFTFMHQFDKLGVFYYISTDQPEYVGTVEVRKPPQVAQISLRSNEIHPKVIVIDKYDVACWTMRRLAQDALIAVEARGKSIYEITTELPEMNAINAPVHILDEPNAKMLRRCFSRTFEQPGIYHFSSRAFINIAVPGSDGKISDSVVSTVIVDDIPDREFVIVSADEVNCRLEPAEVTVSKGQTVLWLPVSSKAEESRVTVRLEGMKSKLRAHKTLKENYLVFTFDTIGTHSVRYFNGENKCAGTVIVQEVANKAPTPEIIQIDRNVRLETSERLENSEIYYTLDGSIPLPGRPRTFVYSSEEDVMIQKGKYVIVRARCVVPGYAYSEVKTSDRLWLQSEMIFTDMRKPELGYIDLEIKLTCKVVPLSGAVQIHIAGVGRLDQDVDTLMVVINRKPYPKGFPPYTTNIYVCGLTPTRRYDFQVWFCKGGPHDVEVMCQPVKLIYPPYTPSGTIILSSSLSHTIRPDQDADNDAAFSAMFSWVPVGAADEYTYSFIFNGTSTQYSVTDEQARSAIKKRETIAEQILNDKKNSGAAELTLPRNRCAMIVKGLRYDTVYASYVVAERHSEPDRPLKSNIHFLEIPRSEQTNAFLQDKSVPQFTDVENEAYHEFIRVLSEWDYRVLVEGEQLAKLRQIQKREMRPKHRTNIPGATKMRSRVSKQRNTQRLRKQQQPQDELAVNLEAAAALGVTGT